MHRWTILCEFNRKNVTIYQSSTSRPNFRDKKMSFQKMQFFVGVLVFVNTNKKEVNE